MPGNTPRRKTLQNPTHRCPHCDRAYERSDHLARHLDSHRNERSFQCNICQRRFNRRDVLQRHQTVHEKEIAEGKNSVRRQGERTIQACGACTSSKQSCDNGRPCKRCITKQIECYSKSPKPPRLTSKSEISSHSPGLENVEQKGPSASTALVRAPSSRPSELITPFISPNSGEGYEMLASGSRVYEHTGYNDILPTVSGDIFHQPALNEFPAFFEQVMLPDLETNDIFHDTQQPRVFDFWQDHDVNLSENDIFDTEFIPDFDKIFDLPALPPLSEFDDLGQTPPDDQQSIRHRTAAFQRSLWLWEPRKNQHGFSEEGRIPLKDGDNIPPTYQTRLDMLNIPEKLSQQARDDIFKLVLRVAGSRLSVSSFPSSGYLDTLIKMGLVKRLETDAWIHPYTLYDSQYQILRPELSIALVAAGCVCCGLPSISKTGIVLQEITRLGLSYLVEEDNSVMRDLQYLQASMLWLDLGISCGYTRKMQIAEGYLQPLCTALRRAAAFDRSTYLSITPYSLGDDYDSLQKVWHRWVRQESLKRIVFHLLGHDVEVATTMYRPTIISYTELTLPFPSSRDLWLASSAQSWKDIWMAQYPTSGGCPDLNLRDLLSEPTLSSDLPPEIDHEIARSALSHGMAIQVLELRQQKLLINPRATTQLWLQSRQEELYTMIQGIKESALESPQVAILMNEFIMMYLHIDIDAIHRFVGKMGELEARRVYPVLKAWSQTKEARIAIWHAGQVFRTARLVMPFQFRAFDSLAIYHATLVLWIYGLLQYGEKEPMVQSSITDIEPPPPVSLDGPEDQKSKAFLSRGTGCPGVTYLHTQDSKTFCELKRPRSVMAVAKQIFEGNCPAPLRGDILPPMIQNLCSLIEELGNLP